MADDTILPGTGQTIAALETGGKKYQKVSGAMLAERVDEVSGTLMYVGYSAPGTLTSAAEWAIKRVDSSAGIVTTWADGEATANQIWDNRASLTYS